MLPHSPRSVRTVPALQVLALVLTHLPTASAVPEPATTFQVRERIAVAQFQSSPTVAREARLAQNTLKEALRKYQSMEVLSADSWERALKMARAPRHGCSSDECQTAAARLLHANTLVTGSLMKGPEDWVLTLGATTPSSGSPVHASLHLQQPKHLGANVQLCLTRLLAIWPQGSSASGERDATPDAVAPAADPGIVRVRALDHRKDHPAAAPTEVTIRHVVSSGNDVGGGTGRPGQGRP